MHKFSLNLSMFFKDKDLFNSFRLARELGFSSVEFWFPFEYKVEKIRKNLNKYDLDLIMINTPSGNVEEGDWGILNDPRRKEAFREGFRDALNYASELNCRCINVLAGTDKPGISESRQKETAIENLKEIAPLSREEGLLLVIEALNLYDFPQYLVNTSSEVFEMIEEAGEPNVLMSYDFYHMQTMEGNLIRTFSENIDNIGHCQFADVPGRNEPGTGEINFKNVLKKLEELDYEGYIGLEYEPSSDDYGSCLSWMEGMGFP